LNFPLVFACFSVAPFFPFFPSLLHIVSYDYCFCLLLLSIDRSTMSNEPTKRKRSRSSAGSAPGLGGAVGSSGQKRTRGELLDESLIDTEENEDNLHFEDPYADVDSEEDIIDHGEDSDDSDGFQAMDAIDGSDYGEEDDEDDDDDDDDDDGDDEGAGAGDGDDKGQEGIEVEPRVWRAGIDQLQEGEVLDYDSSVYEMMHSLRVEWPCLTFAIINDKLGYHRTKVCALMMMMVMVVVVILMVILMVM
jgi:hypothetical protein